MGDTRSDILQCVLAYLQSFAATRWYCTQDYTNKEAKLLVEHKSVAVGA
jgi:hypothetical protein